MKKILLLSFVAILASCGIPSVDDLIQDKEKFNTTHTECMDNDGGLKSKVATFHTHEECRNLKEAAIKITSKIGNKNVCSGIDLDRHLCELSQSLKYIVKAEYRSKLIVRMNYLLENRNTLKATYNYCRTLLYKKLKINPKENQRMDIALRKIKGMSFSTFSSDSPDKDMVDFIGKDAEFACRAASFAAGKLNVRNPDFFENPL